MRVQLGDHEVDYARGNGDSSVQSAVDTSG